VRLEAALYLSALLWSAPARGQVSVAARRAIDWGTLAAGTDTRIDPRDADRRGEIELAATGPNEVRVSFPSFLISPKGDRIPVAFRTGDVLVIYARTGVVLVPDPGLPFSVDVTPATGDATVWIGGTATPVARPHPGRYEATITVVTLASTLTAPTTQLRRTSGSLRLPGIPLVRTP
jgi:hypothetical protein